MGGRVAELAGAKASLAPLGRYGLPALVRLGFGSAPAPLSYYDSPQLRRVKFIAYLRVSTDKQGLDGNGMAAQRKAVEDYLNGGRLLPWRLSRTAS